MTEKETKKQWILDYMAGHREEFIDITAEDFVLAFVDAFQIEVIGWFSYGAPNVPELEKLLAELYKEKKVERYRHYCDIWQDGYPRWYYIYYLKSRYEGYVVQK